jgi:hypothetical protein
VILGGTASAWADIAVLWRPWPCFWSLTVLAGAIYLLVRLIREPSFTSGLQAVDQSPAPQRGAMSGGCWWFLGVAASLAEVGRAIKGIPTD